MTENEALAAATRSVVTVGAGRGFVIEAGADKLVITAAHCLPHFPPAHAASYLEKRTYPKLLGTLDGGEPEVWAECLFADPIGDIAVLGPPDSQELFAKHDAYEALIENTPALPVSEAVAESEAWLLSLAGSWGRCLVRHHENGPLWIEDAADGIHGGMSGSPILAGDGSAIGIVSVAGAVGDNVPTGGGPNPSLMGNLPNWLVQQLG